VLRFHYILQLIKNLSYLIGLKQEAIVAEARLNLVVLGVRDMLCPFAALTRREEAIGGNGDYYTLSFDLAQGFGYSATMTADILAIDAIQ
jgi:hypothetical protein